VLVAGRRAYVTGESNRAGYSDAWIGAFHRSGSRPWSGWFASVDPQTHDYGKHLALNADRSKLYLAASAGDFMALVSLDPASGTQDWAEFPIPQAGGQDRVSAVAVAPDGQSIFLTGQSEDPFSDPTFLTVAYDADGNELWTAWEDDANDEGGALDIGVSPEGSEVYVTGYGRNTLPAVQGPLTVAYDAATGEPSLWEHLSTASTFSGANALAVDPVTGAVVVAGELDLDFFVEAYGV
jgi:DNA-binding beta-propeller fold protein YncE